jgi:hypothetical protein
MPEKLKKPELPPNVVKIETKEGIFRIAYGVHTVPQKPEDVKGTDAIMLESGDLEYHLAPEKAIKALHELSQHTQYRNIIEKAAEARQPIYLTDVYEGLALDLLRMFLGATEMLIAFEALVSLYKLGREMIRTSKMTRRDFLKLVGKTFLATYFGSHFVETLSSLAFPIKGGIDEKTAIRKINRFLINLNEKSHPEVYTVVLTLRNLIMAQKLITIAKEIHNEIDEKPEIGVVVGGGHIGIERALKLTTKERMNTIGKILSIPGLKGLRENVAAIARFDYDPQIGKWQLTKFYKDPSLLNLEN